MSVSTGDPARGPRASPRWQGRGLALGLLCFAQFLTVLDTTVVNVVLPAIRRDLGFGSQAELQYVISLYALTFGGLLILAGRVADLCGRRRIFLTGLLVFALASTLCGLAPTGGVLLAGRALQGIGAALVAPAAMALLTSMFPEGAERDRALGAWGAAGGFAGAAGFVVGGLVTAAASWEWVFFLNLPLTAATALAALRVLPTGTTGEAGTRRLDLPGAVTITAGLGLVIVGLSRGEQAGFAAPSTIGLLTAAAALLAAFVVVERRARQPIVAPRLFRLPGLAAANIAGVLLTTIIASNIFFATLYTQQVLGFSSLQTGLAFLPHSVLVLAGSAVASRCTGRLGPGPILAAGFAALAAGSLLLTGISVDGSYLADVLPGFALIGLGLGLAFVAVTVGATTGVAERDHGMASGIVNTAVQVGFAVGIAAVVAAAHALAEGGADNATATLVDGYAGGYLIDTALAATGLVIALATTRTSRRHRTSTNPASNSTPP